MSQHESKITPLELKVDDIAFYLFGLTILLLECSLFYLKLLPSTFFKACGYNLKTASILLIMAALFFYLITSLRGSSHSSYKFGTSILVFSGMCLVLCIVSSFVYDAAFFSVFSVALPFIVVPLAYFLLHEMVEDEAKYSFIISAFIAIAALYSVICILESAGLSLMDSNYQYMSFRDGRLRLVMSGDFVAVGMVLALGRVFRTGKMRVLNCGLALLMAVELYWVAQTRFLLIGVFAAATVGFVISGKNKAFKVVLVFLALVLLSSQFSNQISSVLFPDELNVSSTARVNAYSYYWMHAYDLGLFGLGYIPSGSPHSTLLAMITTSGFERGDITDIGIVGYFARYGLLGLVSLAILVYQFIRLFQHRVNKHPFSGNPEAWMVLAFVVAISPTMAITDPQRILYLPFVVLLIEHALTCKNCFEE